MKLFPFIRNKILLKILVPLIFLLSILTVTLNYFFTNNLKKNLKDFLIKKIFITQFEQLANEKDQTFEQIKNITKYTANKITERLTSINISPEEIDSLYLNYLKQCEDSSWISKIVDRTDRFHMTAFRNKKGDVSNLEKKILIDAFLYFYPYCEALNRIVYNTYFTTNKLHWNYGSYDWTKIISTNENFSNYLWFYLADPFHNTSKNHKWTPIYYDNVNKHWMTSSLYPVYFNDSFIGTVGQDFLLHGIIDLTQNKDNFKSSIIFFIDYEGNIIAHPETRSLIFQEAENSQQINIKSISDINMTFVYPIIKNSENSGYIITENNKLIIYIPLESINWTLIYTVDENEIFWIINQINIAHIFALFIFLCISIIFIVFIIKRSIINPLKNLLLGIDKVKNGNLDIVIKEKNRDDELGKVIISFNNMIKSLKNSQQQLLQSQKMESIGLLAGGIAHDFNNLLTVINGHSEMCLLNIDKNNINYSEIKAILKAGKKASELTSQLLTFGRKQIYKPIVLNLNENFFELTKMMRRMLSEEIIIKEYYNKNIPNIKADPGHIQQIIMNLFLNSQDALNESKKKEKILKISTDFIQIKNKKNIKDGDWVIFSISDNGIGMSKEIQKKIFDPFYTTKEVGKGTGLGLSTVYAIINQNNAFIEVKSQLNIGTTFNIYWFPTDEEIIINEDSKQIENNNLKSNILIVEDNEDVRDFLKTALETFGYSVLSAENGEKAVEVFKDNINTINLIITDIIMPVMNGKELEEKIKKIKPDMKILFASGYSNKYLTESGILNKNTYIIHKPYSLKNLREIIENILTININ